MKTTKNAFALALLALLLLPAPGLGQDDKDKPGEHGYVDFGFRNIWGDEYGRPDLPFTPNVRTSKYNEYRDVRDGFFIRRAAVNFDNIRGGDSWFNFQTQRSIYKDGSYLATLGRYNHYRIQFRYDEIPHIYTNTSRILYTEVSPGAFTIPIVTRTQLQTLAAQTTAPCTATTVGCLLPSTIQNQMVPSLQFV